MNSKSKQISLSIKKDGRHLRSVKTQESIVNSTIELLMESPLVQWPTAEQVAKHSDIGLRTVFRQFEQTWTTPFGPPQVVLALGQ